MSHSIILNSCYFRVQTCSLREQAHSLLLRDAHEVAHCTPVCFCIVKFYISFCLVGWILLPLASTAVIVARTGLYSWQHSRTLNPSANGFCPINATAFLLCQSLYA